MYEEDDDNDHFLSTPSHTAHFPAQMTMADLMMPAPTTSYVALTSPPGMRSTRGEFERRYSHEGSTFTNPDEDEPLLSEGGEHRSWCGRFYRFLRKCTTRAPRQLLARDIHLNNPSPIADGVMHSDELDGASVGDLTRVYPSGPYPSNAVRNQKYSIITFLPLFLYNEFRFFFNLYFLVVALSQFVPLLQVGFLFTYVAPLAMVLSVAMAKEIHDDYQRYSRDKEANAERYPMLSLETLLAHPREDDPATLVTQIPARDIKPGHILLLEAGRRVPCDCVVLKCLDREDTAFIKTDQLDGETDWKVRRPPHATQSLAWRSALTSPILLRTEAPKLDIYDFAGNITVGEGEVEPLSLENTLWSSTVVASGRVLALAVYTGADTRCVLNASSPRSKVGSLDEEVNRLAKVLFVLTFALALTMVLMKGLDGLWFVQLFRYILLFSSIIPVSLRVNLDMAKLFYSQSIDNDMEMPGAAVRSSTLPEELGHISYVFTDKTGTLTTNTMKFKALQLAPPLAFTSDTVGVLAAHIRAAYNAPAPNDALGISDTPENREKIRAAVEAVALCHSVTPIGNDVDGLEGDEEIMSNDAGIISHNDNAYNLDDNFNHHDDNNDNSHGIEYQAASPDEVALVSWVASIGLQLTARDTNSMTVHTPAGIRKWEILEIFPFTSTSKRMGIIVKSEQGQNSGQIFFLLKGAESAVLARSAPCPWAEEEVVNFARSGLRTLVFAKRQLSHDEYALFSDRLRTARSALNDREQRVAEALATLERNLEVVCVTAVEDKLQSHVRSTLESLRHAGVRVWMLTGDKAETAASIGLSTRLVERGQHIISLECSSKSEAAAALDRVAQQAHEACLMVDGASLAVLLEHFPLDFAAMAQHFPAVICCRCAPTQKAAVVALIKKITTARTLAVGDGGNDVAMIQAAHVGVGILGKEGSQAAMAADFQISEFQQLQRLLLWHGRNSYKRSAALAQFIMHRGLVISVIQAVFSALYFFVAVPIYTGWLMVGYTSLYTMLPVLALVLDEDVTPHQAFMFPQLYGALMRSKPLSLRTFFQWVFLSVYQGGLIMVLGIALFESAFVRIVSITFTALVLVELANLAFAVHRWKAKMVYAQILSIIAYIFSMIVLTSYFDLAFILTGDFFAKTAIIVAACVLPPVLVRMVIRLRNPQTYSKLAQA